MKIAFLGDIALIGKYDLTTNPFAIERLKILEEKLSEYDYVIANLETPLTEKTKTMICKSMHLRTPIINVDLLKFLHINAVTLANNHIHDFGTEGLIDTIKALEKNGIEWFGANSKSLIKEIKGEKVCFSGFCCYSTNATGYIMNKGQIGVNTLTYEKIMKQLDNDKENNAFSVFSIHWGTEHTNYPMYEHLCLAKKIAMKKDVLIHGHHPHVIQGIQKINGSLVAYSLGNCLFDDCASINGAFILKQNENNKKSFILEAEIKKGKINNYNYIGFKDEDKGIIFFDVTQEMRLISEKLNNINDLSLYNKIRKEQFDKAVLEKIGNRDLSWFISRLNYYSIGARLIAIFIKEKFKNEVKKFVGE